MGKKVVGLTGGIGSGKSLLSGYLKELGCEVLNADEIAHEIMNTDEAVMEEIIDEFGKESYENGQINRKFLSDKVFNSSTGLETINAIVHPAVLKKLDTMTRTILKDSDLVFVESAILFESDIYAFFDYIINISSDLEARKKRLVKSRNMTEEEITARMDKQLSDDERTRMSDFTIVNNGTSEELKNKAVFFINLLNSLT